MTFGIEAQATLVKLVVIPVMLMNTVPLLVWVERRGSAFIQDRHGPNRAALFGIRLAGLLHTIADAVKFLTKEPLVPAGAHRLLYVMAPAIVLVPAIVAFAVIPIADDIAIGGVAIPMAVARLDGGIVYVFAVASLGVIGLIIAGWASGSKYSLLGALRSASQMLSYEVSLGLSAAGALLCFQTLDPNEIVRAQGDVLWAVLSTDSLTLGIPRWGVLLQPLGFILLLVTGFAECNRTPFDLPEGDSELVAGYHTEYSGMKFALFFMAEYISMITMSALVVTLYFGGWQVPCFPTDVLDGAVGMWGRLALQLAAFALKVGFFLWLFVWVRWTVPRFRYDQLMSLGWKVILPLSLVNLVVTGVVVVLCP